MEVPWHVVRSGALVCAGYVAWIIAFERWIDPALRRWVGVVVGCPVRWVQVAGPFRNWGVAGVGSDALEAGVGLTGAAAVAAAALLPAVITNVLVRAELGESPIAGATYLMTVPVVVIVATRLLLGRVDPRG
jgi:hypothetical protein